VTATPVAVVSLALVTRGRRMRAGGAPERTILSLPLDAKRSEPSRQERYAAFRRRSDGIFPRPLPEAIGHCQFAYFDARGPRGAHKLRWLIQRRRVY
jgi:hypothetical protein